MKRYTAILFILLIVLCQSASALTSPGSPGEVSVNYGLTTPYKIDFNLMNNGATCCSGTIPANSTDYSFGCGSSCGTDNFTGTLTAKIYLTTTNIVPAQCDNLSVQPTQNATIQMNYEDKQLD